MTNIPASVTKLGTQRLKGLNVSTTPSQFAEAWVNNGFSPERVARALGIHVRNVYARRAYLESIGYQLPSHTALDLEDHLAYKLREELYVDNAVAVIASDRHKWPGDGVTAAESALLTLLPQIQPDIFILNGDLFDGARITRHPPLGWERKPDVNEELNACKEVLANIEARLKPGALKLYTVGNHCRRFDYRLALTASEYRGVAGFSLADHFANWKMSWSIHINPGVNGGHTVIKHKHRGGVTAGRNNAMTSGVTIVTGHTHSLSATPIEDYRGRRWGVECGFLSHRMHPAFEYTEDAPSYARPGFVVLTWRAGVLLPPELVEVDDSNTAWFRGDAIATEKPRIRVPAISQRIIQ